jgi:hypothetical protein
MPAVTPESKIVEETNYIMDACFQQEVLPSNPFFHNLLGCLKEDTEELEEMLSESVVEQPSIQNSSVIETFSTK